MTSGFERPRRRRSSAAAAASVTLLLMVLVVANRLWPSPFSSAEIDGLRDLAFVSGTAPPPPPDPSNRVADDPAAARLGARLFRDARLSANGQVACASCHQPARAYTDGLTLARGMDVGPRNTPSIVSAAASAWYFWDGRRDSQWAQALVPLEGYAEHGTTRAWVAQVVAGYHRGEYEAVFGRLPAPGEMAHLPRSASPLGSHEARVAWNTMPAADQQAVDRIFANVGKALAAYQRRLTLRPARFDRYVGQLVKGNRFFASLLLSADEVAGLKLFVGRGDCVLCHRGPMLSSYEFFALGLPHGAAGPDPGRAAAFEAVRRDPFNCAGAHNDAHQRECSELRYMSDDRLGFLANFKTPSLRNVALTAPYMHAGQLPSLERVIEHYSRAPSVPFPEHTDIRPRNFTTAEAAQLVAFLGTLTSPVDDPFADE